MSLKTFERRFTEQVGTPPKVFARMIRFNQALRLKMKYPGQTWTSIAHTLGYFDQMHLIKEFKLFSGETPTSFLRHLPPPSEEVVMEKKE